jgi:FlaA1/EpsC-like NDP-sugar epimerase
MNRVLIDIVIFAFSYFTAFFIRFEGVPVQPYLQQLLLFFPYVALARLLCFHFFSIYSIIWRYISIMDVMSMFKACFPVTALLFLGRVLLPDRFHLFRLPLSVIALEFFLVLGGTLGVRIVRRLLVESSERESLEVKGGGLKRKRALLIGAGAAGIMVLKELRQRPDLAIDVRGFIDDDPKKLKNIIQGVRVLGNTARIPEVVKKLDIEEIIITIANASSKDIKRIVEVCTDIKLKAKIVPGLFEILNDKVRVSKIREINIVDLLGRRLVSFITHLPEIIIQYK